MAKLLRIDVVAVSHFIHFMIFARVDNFAKSVVARGLASKGRKFEEAPPRGILCNHVSIYRC